MAKQRKGKRAKVLKPISFPPPPADIVFIQGLKNPKKRKFDVGKSEGE